jgi:hypothetical protein
MLSKEFTEGWRVFAIIVIAAAIGMFISVCDGAMAYELIR